MDNITLDADTLRCAAAQAVATLKLLANEDRLLLLCHLTQGEFCVSEIQAKLGIEQPTLSQQLGVLRRQSLVSTRRQGKHIYYSAAPGPSLEVLQVLYRLYCPQGQG
jgi:DNA-binding transcriptional ArsR family regulator